MLRTYFKIAWRNLKRNVAFSAINLVGLSIGLATCLLISLFVLDELSYDRFHTHADRIHRVVLRGTLNGESIREANVMAPVASTLRATFPEVQATVRLFNTGTPRLTYGEKSFREDQLVYADSTLFRVFTLPLRKGDPQTALTRPNTVVLTTQTAQRYFGTDDPMGKVLTRDNGQTPLTVTGVMEAVPTNSHVHFDLVASLASLPEANNTNWLQSNFFTYVLLPEGYDPRQLETKLRPVSETHLVPPLEKLLGLSRPELKRKGTDLGLYLQPLTAIHLHSDLKPETELEPGGDVRYVYLFGAIAGFMLLLACINFMNLSTAGASTRAKEVGVRKVLGSARGPLMGQFLSESALFTVLSLGVALGVVAVALPLFNALSGKTLSLQHLLTPSVLLGLVGFGALVSLLAGSYPAFYLSSFRPIAVLKGLRIPSGRGNLRSGLVVFQFGVSISLIIGTTVVYRQLRYIQNIKLGYDKEQVLVLEGTGVLGRNEEVLRQRLTQDSRVRSASVSNFLPNDRFNTGMIGMQPDRSDAQMIRMVYFGIDPHYLPTLGMNLVAGRNFSADFPSDSSAVLVNETAVRHFGWTDNPLGHTLTNPALPQNGRAARTFRVVGVVKDFHYRSLHERIAPTVMVLNDNAGAILVKARTDDVAGLLTSLKQQWAAFKTGEPFRYSFLDESYAAMHRAEQRTSRILSLFAVLTVFVACLGLFGLATFTAEQRTKEIGVRKVLGASVPHLVALLSRDFLKPVLIAFVLASPVAWYALNRWLEDFAYRIEIELWVFALAGVLAVAIALLTVSFQSVKAALMNPVKSLRSE
jgi:putative ABC transport system permease protein